MGCSAAHFLVRKGWKNIVVVDQGPLFETGGSTSHAPGLIFQLNVSRAMCQLARWSVELYSGIHGGFYDVGSLEIACSPERHEELKRKLGHALSWGLPAAMLGPEETRRKSPILNTGRVLSALHVPSDGIAKGVRIAEALAASAQQQGAEFFSGAPVTEIEIRDGRVRAVVTPHGRIETARVLLCAGIWGPRVGRLAGVPIPLVPVEHQYARTAPIPQLAGETREVAHPILRHQDWSMYFRQHADSYGIGSYRHEPILADVERLGSTAVRPFTSDHFEQPYQYALELFPCFQGVALASRINGIFSFTPDGNPLVGEAPQIKGFWIAEAVWVTHAGGVGKVVAEWMTDGRPSLDLRELDYNRFPAHAFTAPYLRARAAQQYREVYDIIHPSQQMENPRGLRVSPFHGRQRELGAVFFESAGWERPQWFAANESLPAARGWPERNGWTARNWSPIIGKEHQATRSGVALYDLTPFTKLELSGCGALGFLQGLASNDLNQAVGRILYTSMLDDPGGIQCDLTITRLAEDRFLVVTGGAVGTHDVAWIRRHLPPNSSVRLTEITGAVCCIGAWGPLARQLMARVSQDDFSNTGFPYLTAHRISLGCIPALALRISYVGELGWEIYAPTECGLQVWDALWEAGASLGVIAAGGGAFDSLRLEKGYRLWGSDIHADYNPLEAGLSFAVKMRKGEFLGRAAIERARAQGLSRRLCCLTLDNPQAVVLGKEPIFHGDAVVGYVTSANYGYTVGKSIAYGYLPVECAHEGTRLTVYFFGARHAATVSRDPLYDPEGRRLRE